MKTLLVILFLIDGQPTVIADGYAPLKFETEDVCQQRAEFMRDYFDANPEAALGVPYEIDCVDLTDPESVKPMIMRLKANGVEV